MAEIKWIKVLTDIFEDEKIKLIKSMPEGRTLVLIWFQFLMQAGKTNAGGWIFMNEKTPYSIQNLSTLFNESIQMVELSIRVFSSEAFEMIEVDSIGRIYIPNWEKHQAVDKLDKIREDTKKRVADHRNKKKLHYIEGNVTGNADVTQGNAAEIELELELDIDKEKDIVHPPQFDEFWLLFPRKNAKQDAISAWGALKKNKVDLVEVMKATKNYAQQCKGKEMEFVKLPATFLRKERWKDSLAPLATGRIGDDRKEMAIAKQEAFTKWVRDGNEPDEFNHNSE